MIHDADFWFRFEAEKNETKEIPEAMFFHFAPPHRSLHATTCIADWGLVGWATLETGTQNADEIIWN
jgi:hypothetical protein